jgi:RNA polymerase sigma factor (sigma-70 family)
MTGSGKTSLAEFITRNNRSLVNFVRTKLSDTSHRDSEDIVQDVILGLLNRPDITYPILNMSAYVFSALKNRIVDEYRKPRNTVLSLDEINSESQSLYDILPDLKFEPRGSYAREKLAEEINEAINSLPEAQQEVIIETELNGISFKELSRRNGTPVGTLLARKHRGLTEVKKKLKEEYHG